MTKPHQSEVSTCPVKDAGSLTINFASGHTYLRPLQNLAFSSRVSRMKDEAAWGKWEESRKRFKPDALEIPKFFVFFWRGGTEEN